MKKTLLLSIITIMLSFMAACSGDKEKEGSPLDGQPVPAPDKPDIPE
jgi:hypothetical protein|tara:strand:- start:93 stop:233 length:141 start_codon:yes stop_codon:yes gene_type:complete